MIRPTCITLFAIDAGDIFNVRDNTSPNTTIDIFELLSPMAFPTGIKPVTMEKFVYNISRADNGYLMTYSKKDMRQC